MPEVIAPSERVYRSIQTHGFLTACQDWTKSFINLCGFWSTWRTTEVSVAGLTKGTHLGQALLMAIDTMKLHKQLELQQGPCGCASLRAHRTTDMLGTAVCTAELFSSKSLCFFLHGNVILTSSPLAVLQVQPWFPLRFRNIWKSGKRFFFFSKGFTMKQTLFPSWVTSVKGEKSPGLSIPHIGLKHTFLTFVTVVGRSVRDLFQFISSIIVFKEPAAFLSAMWSAVSQCFCLYNFHRSSSALSTSLSLPSMGGEQVTGRNVEQLASKPTSLWLCL